MALIRSTDDYNPFQDTITHRWCDIGRHFILRDDIDSWAEACRQCASGNIYISGRMFHGLGEYQRGTGLYNPKAE